MEKIIVWRKGAIMVDPVSTSSGSPPEKGHHVPANYKSQYHWNKKSMDFAEKVLGPNSTQQDRQAFLDNLAKGMGDWINHQQSQYEQWRQDMIDQGLLPNPSDAG
jgi:hypothetical protein